MYLRRFVNSCIPRSNSGSRNSQKCLIYLGYAILTIGEDGGPKSQKPIFFASGNMARASG